LTLSPLGSQNLDSSEISLTDVSHYFDSDPTKLVQSLRNDGKSPSAYIADTTTANAQVRTLGETVRLDARTKLLNPKWYEGMLGSGYEGVREIQKRLTNTMGWSATSGMVDNWVYDEANATFIEDDAMAKVRGSTGEGWSGKGRDDHHSQKKRRFVRFATQLAALFRLCSLISLSFSVCPAPA